MAKGKSLNPADAYRKAMRKKELKKNKTERSKARELTLVKKDTQDMEDEIEKLEAASDLSAADKSRLTELKTELIKINEKKEAYVKEHPEHRKLVYRFRRDKEGDQPQPPAGEQKRNLFNKHGLPRHPERSIYYDSVLNPYGVPPPGMPYIERPLREDEVSSDQGNAEDSDEDIVMPEGPPPGTKVEDDDSNSDEDIPMPEGPPPSVVQSHGSAPPLPSSISPAIPQPPTSFHPRQPPLPPLPASFLPPHPAGSVPPPPPPLPPGFGDNALLPYPSGNYNSMAPFPPTNAMQPIGPPPGFFPRQATSVQDPLLSIPHQTYQAQRSNRLPPGHPSLPPKPPSTSVPAIHPGSSATISAEPELRDLKKEATAFVPPSLKKKKASALPATSRVNAAPSVSRGGSESRESPPAARPDLVSALRDQFGAPPAPPVKKSSLQEPVPKSKDDYHKFLDEMSDILGTPKP